jgi:hypothetical protein
LRLDYGTLKRHVHQGAGVRPRFVELPVSPVAADAIIEIERAGGLTVRVRLPGRPLAEIADVARRVADPPT